MDCKTKNALLFLIIGQILAILSAVLLYVSLFSFNLEGIAFKNSTDMLLITAPGTGLGVISAILMIIGAILFLLGRKEFGDKHQKFVFYAIIIFIISIGVVIIIGIVSAMVSLLPMIQGFKSSDLSQIIESIRNSNFISIIASLSPISAALGGLIWIFALYNLEEIKGRNLLYVALIFLIATSIAVGITSVPEVNNFINSDVFENSITSEPQAINAFTQILSYYQWIGTSGVINVAGTVISNLLLLFALYIPYQRIKSGELVPIVAPSKQPDIQPDRVCPNCGKAIPFDANICPYCSKRFDNYL